MTLGEIGKLVGELTAEATYQRQKLSDERRLLEQAKKHAENVTAATLIVQDVAKHVQEQAHASIAAVVSRSLAAVYEDPYEFRILFEKKRNRTEARLVFYRDGMEVDPGSQSGVGPVDVAAFALKLACLLVRRPSVRKLVVADEPFKHVDEEKMPRVRALLLTLAEEFGFQFVIVTHQRELRCGKVVEL